MKYKKLKDGELTKLIDDVLSKESSTKSKGREFIIWGLGPKAMESFDKAVKAWVEEEKYKNNNMNNCECEKPTIVIPKQWTIWMPPSGDTPEPIYMCSVCGLSKIYKK